MNKVFISSFLIPLVFNFCTAPEKPLAYKENQPWDHHVKEAKGSVVKMAMWGGDPMINRYMDDFVAPHLEEKYGIQLDIAYAQGNAIVSQIMAESVAGSHYNSYDLVWINGETFYQLRQLDALLGNWTKRLPNAAFVDFENPFIGTDFNQPIEEFECPWGNVQFTLIYNQKFVNNPPQTREELLNFVQNNPGKFTFDMSFTGLTLLKSWLIDLSGSPNGLNGPFDAKLYNQLSKKLWAFIKEIKPHLWKGGETYPENVAVMHQMFASEELWFTMSNNHAEVDNKIIQGLFPVSARPYIPKYGSIRNTHYLGIPLKSMNQIGAMITTNFLVSPEAQLQKANPAIWGDGTILKSDALPDSIKSQFETIPNINYTPNLDRVIDKALKEPAPEYMINLARDFRAVILQEE